MKSPLVKGGRALNLLNQQAANWAGSIPSPACAGSLRAVGAGGGSELELNGQEVVVTGMGGCWEQGGGVGVAVPAAEPGAPQTPWSFPAVPHRETQAFP